MIIPHRRNRPNIGGPITCIPLGMAVPPQQREQPVPPTELTTLHITQRCQDCAWPKICEKDNTCWNQEKHEPWTPSRPVMRKVESLPWTAERIVQWVHNHVTEHGRVPNTEDLKRKNAPKHIILRYYGYTNLADLVSKCGYEPYKKRRWNK